jgi:hypothetical protein
MLSPLSDPTGQRGIVCLGRLARAGAGRAAGDSEYCRWAEPTAGLLCPSESEGLGWPDAPRVRCKRLADSDGLRGGPRRGGAPAPDQDPEGGGGVSLERLVPLCGDKPERLGSGWPSERAEERGSRGGPLVANPASWEQRRGRGGAHAQVG